LVGRGDYRIELHELPIVAYGWLGDEVKNLRPGQALTVIAHLNGTKYTPDDGGPTRPGVQIIADSLTYPMPRRQPIRELANE
jgi:hypothetical protein